MDHADDGDAVALEQGDHFIENAKSAPARISPPLADVDPELRTLDFVPDDVAEFCSWWQGAGLVDLLEIEVVLDQVLLAALRYDKAHHNQDRRVLIGPQRLFVAGFIDVAEEHDCRTIQLRPPEGGACVAVSGIIGFIGLVVPHVVRLLVGSDHRRVLPTSVLVGSTFTVLGDLLARTVVAPQEMPMGVVTAFHRRPHAAVAHAPTASPLRGRPMIELDDVSVDIGHRRIVDHVSLTVADGQVVGLLGPNGSGKSTLLTTLFGVRRPATGAVRLDGVDLTAISRRDAARRIAVLTQDGGVEFDATAAEIVMIGRTPHQRGLSRDSRADRDEVMAAPDRVGCADLTDRSVHTLSGGERQRVFIARALAQGCDHLVLDEPTNHLDIRYQIEVLDIVSRLGVGVLAALHDLSLVVAVPSRSQRARGRRPTWFRNVNTEAGWRAVVDHVAAADN